MTATLSPIRVGKVTASRLPAVLGLSPYTTRSALMRSMVREYFGDTPEFVDNPATRWGKRFEAQVAAEYELTTGVALSATGQRQQTRVHPVHAWLAATPDGLTADRVVELKAPWKARWTSLADRPDHEAQLRLQMEVTGRRLGDLVVWRPDQPLSIETVTHDPDWLPGVLPAAQAFITEFWEVVADPALADPHRQPLKDVRTDDEWSAAAIEWLELDYLIEQLSGRRDAAAEILKELAPDKSARGAGVDLLRYRRRGAINHRKALADVGATVDLDAYRGPGTQVVSIRRIGENKEEK